MILHIVYLLNSVLIGQFSTQALVVVGSRFLEPNVTSLGFVFLRNTAILPSIFSNEFSFSLDVRDIGIPLQFYLAVNNFNYLTSFCFFLVKKDIDKYALINYSLVSYPNFTESYADVFVKVNAVAIKVVFLIYLLPSSIHSS